MIISVIQFLIIIGKGIPIEMSYAYKVVYNTEMMPILKSNLSPPASISQYLVHLAIYIHLL